MSDDNITTFGMARLERVGKQALADRIDTFGVGGTVITAAMHAGLIKFGSCVSSKKHWQLGIEYRTNPVLNTETVALTSFVRQAYCGAEGPVTFATLESTVVDQDATYPIVDAFSKGHEYLVAGSTLWPDDADFDLLLVPAGAAQYLSEAGFKIIEKHLGGPEEEDRKARVVLFKEGQKIKVEVDFQVFLDDRSALREELAKNEDH